MEKDDYDLCESEDYINFLIEVAKNECCKEFGKHNFNEKKAFDTFLKKIKKQS